MSIRDLTVIVIRLMAVWIICSIALGAVSWMTALAEALVGGTGPWGGRFSYASILWLPFAHTAATIGVAIALLYFAPRIADFVCRDVDSERATIPTLSLGAGDVYTIAAFLLGVFVMLRAVHPALSVVVELMGQRFVSQTGIVTIAAALVYILCGGALSVGSRGVAQFLVSLGHSSDHTPSQRFSVRLLLVIVTLCAVVLGLIRALIP